MVPRWNQMGVKNHVMYTIFLPHTVFLVLDQHLSISNIFLITCNGVHRVAVMVVL